MKSNLVPAVLCLLAAGLAWAGPKNEDVSLRRARELLQKHPVIDGHNDLPYVIREHGKPMRDVNAYDLRTTTPGDHVAIGSDFYGERAQMAIGLEDTSRYPALFAELIRRGWSDEDLAKLSRGNLLRVLRAAERTAVRLQQSRPPSYRTIEELDRGQSKPNVY